MNDVNSPAKAGPLPVFHDAVVALREALGVYADAAQAYMAARREYRNAQELLEQQGHTLEQANRIFLESRNAEDLQ